MAECLRCGQPVVDLANWLIAQELERIPKQLQSVTDWDATIHSLRFPTREDEAREVARMAAEEIDAGRNPEDILILVRSDRNNQASDLLATALGEHEIELYRPRLSAGLDDALQRLIEYLRLAESIARGSTDDLSLRSLLEIEENGIGDTRVRALVRLAWNRECTFVDAVNWIRDHPEDFPSTSPELVLQAVDVIQQRATALALQEGESFKDWVDRVENDLDLSAELRETVRVAAKEVEAVLADIPEGTAAAKLDFVQELGAALSNVEDTRPPVVAGSVTITTMHGGKGLSADVVFVLQAEDEGIPDHLTGIEYDESRRLLYVSLTRAKRTLVISTCVVRAQLDFVAEQQVPVQRSLTRFLADSQITTVWGTDYHTVAP